MIPNYIFQTWKTKTNIDPIRSKYVKSIKQYNPSMKYYLYDDQDCDTFVKDKFPKYYPYYQKLELPVQKADLWRYLVIYYYGGYYLDIDCISVKSFSKLIKKYNKDKDYDDCNDLLIIEVENPAPLKFINGFPRNPQYAQYWFGATPRHPAILEVIKLVIRNIRNIKDHDHDHNNISDEETLFLTGPVPWTDGITKYEKNKKDSSIYKIKQNIYDTIAVPFNTQLIYKHKNTPVIHKCAGSWRLPSSNRKFFIIFFVIIIILLLLLIVYFK